MMETILTRAAVRECAATACSFNDDGCRAPAISVAVEGGAARCATFVDVPVRGGLEDGTARVGACSRADCVHNANLTCGAEAVRIGPGATLSDCLTFEAR